MPRSIDLTTCDDILDRLEEHVDGELTAAEAQRVERHLRRCSACAAELTLARRIRAELRALPGPEPAAERPATSAWTRRGGSWTGRHRWQLAAAAGLVLVALAGVLSLDRPPVEAPVQVARHELPYVVSDADLARAEQEARYALARVAEITRRARADLDQSFDALPGQERDEP